MTELFLKLIIEGNDYDDIHPDLAVEDCIRQLADGCYIEVIELDGSYHLKKD